MTLEFRCADVGVVCNGKIRAETPEELVGKIAEHAAHKHGVPKLTETLVNYAKSTVRSVEERK
jgi:predicted small metal-binding protein